MPRQSLPLYSSPPPEAREALRPALSPALKGGRDIQMLYMQQMAATPLLTREEEQDLLRRSRRGDAAAREHLIKANLRLVVRIAMLYHAPNVPLLDRISEGNIGLVIAIDRYRLSGGAKLSTYASWWIRQRISRLVAENRNVVRLPVSARTRLSAIHAEQDKFREENGRAPTDTEIATRLGLPTAKVSRLIAAGAEPLALDATIDEENGGATFGDQMPDESLPSPAEAALTNETHHEIQAALGRLHPRAAEIIRLRFGLDGGGERTLEEVGQRFKVTRERIRQIEATALRRMRHTVFQRERTGEELLAAVG